MPLSATSFLVRAIVSGTEYALLTLTMPLAGTADRIISTNDSGNQRRERQRNNGCFRHDSIQHDAISSIQKSWKRDAFRVHRVGKSVRFCPRLTVLRRTRRRKLTVWLSDARVPLVALILPIATVAAGDVREAIDELDFHHVLRVLVPQLPLDPQPNRRPV